jgi:hypothetical protein
VIREQSDLTCSLYGAFRLIELRQDFADSRMETFSPLLDAQSRYFEDSGVFRMRFSLSNTTATERGHPHTISLKLRDMNHLFNSMDPSPFIEKDLDDDAEEFIVSWTQEFFPNAPIKLRIYLEQSSAGDPKKLIRTAVHNHFAHRAKITDLEFKRLLK